MFGMDEQEGAFCHLLGNLNFNKRFPGFFFQVVAQIIGAVAKMTGNFCQRAVFLMGLNVF